MALTEEQKEDLYGEIENQGFGYWVENYGFKDDKSDKDLVVLCEVARKSMNDLKDYLIEQGVEI